MATAGFKGLTVDCTDK